MNLISKNLSTFIYIFSFLFSIFIYFYIKQAFAWEAIQIIKLTQVYAIISTIYLYLTLLAGSFCSAFSNIPFSVQYLSARKSLGVSSFYFALIHFFLAFYGQLGGFSGLKFLDIRNILIISLGFAALLILALFTASSVQFINNTLFKKSNIIYGLLYVSAIFIIIHAVMMQVHFADLTSPLSLIFFFAIVFLLLLDAARIDLFLQKKLKISNRLKISTIIILILSLFFLLKYGPWNDHANMNMDMEGIEMVPNQSK